MSNNNNNILFWMGLAVGATAGYLLNSDKGRELQKETAVKAQEYGTQIKETSQQQVDGLSKNVNSWIEQGQSFAKEIQHLAKEKINNVSSSAKNMVENTESSFQKGARKAKATVKSQKNQIENAIENGVA